MFILQFTLTPLGKGTVLKVSDTAFGKITDEKIASTREGWTMLLEKCLKRYVEKT